MSKRDFNSIKSLLHFNYPYAGEPHEMLGDDVSKETWYSINVKRAGRIGPLDNVTGSGIDPKFGWRCAFYQGYNDSRIFSTNKYGTFNIDTTKQYEIEAFINWTKERGWIFSTVQMPNPKRPNKYSLQNYSSYGNNYQLRYFEGHTYAVINNSITKVQALEICERLGGHLFRIDNEEKFNYLKSLSANSIWIDGVKDVSNTDFSNITLSNGQVVDYSAYTHSNNSGNDCTNLIFYSYYSRLENSSTTYTSYFVCEWDYIKLPSPYLYFKDLSGNWHTYLFVKAYMTWDEADAFCKQSGGRLVDIDDEILNKMLYGITVNGEDVWINLKENGVGNWQWADRPNETPTYTNWSNGTPSSSGSAHAYKGSEIWYYESNSISRKCFICEWTAKKEFNASFFQCDGHTFLHIPLAMTWADAKAWCEAAGGHLAIPSTAQRQRFIQFFAQNENCWMGGTDEAEEGVWQWIDGTEWDYTNWYSDEPNSGTSYNFIRMDSSSTGKWCDASTSETYEFICEWDSLKDFSNNIELVFDDTGKLVFFDYDENKAAISNVALTANTWQHVLVRINNGNVRIFLDGTEIINTSITPRIITPTLLWLGGYYGYMDEFVFRSSIGLTTPQVPTEPYKALLNINEIGGYGSGVDGDVEFSSGEYVFMLPNKNGEYSIDTSESNEIEFFAKSYNNNTPYSGTFFTTQPYITQLHGHYAYWGGHTFRVMPIAVTWHEAKRFCEYQGGHLATATSADKNNFLRRMAASLGGYDVWIGLLRGENSDTWEWCNSENLIYTNWESNQPATGCDYAYIYGYSLTADGETYCRWKSANISTVKYFLCEWDDIRLPTEYFYFDGHTFRLFLSSSTWDKANTYCTAMGGHLTTSTNQNKNDFLKIVADSRNIWLGGTDKDQEGIWKWVNGEEFNYTNWDTSQPDNKTNNTTNAYALKMNNTGKWSDETGSHTSFFICEWDRIIEDTSGVGLIYYNGRAFKVFNYEKTWDEAEAFCEKLGGHLVTITNEEKANFINMLIKDERIYGNTIYYPWTGAVYQHMNGGGLWTWINGDTWDYYPGWSSEVNGNYGRIYLYSDNKFYEERPTQKHNFVCEWDTPSDTVNFLEFGLNAITQPVLYCGGTVIAGETYVKDSEHNNIWMWRHYLLRIKENTATVYIDGVEAASGQVPSKIFNPDRIGLASRRRYIYNSSWEYSFIDGFSLRHTAGTTAPDYPTVTHVSSDTSDRYTYSINSGGIIREVSGTSLTLDGWFYGLFTPQAGNEVMVHISKPKNTGNLRCPEIGFYAFRHIAAIDGLNITLDNVITTANGDDFTLNADLLAEYYVQIITVPNFENFTYDYIYFNGNNIMQISASQFSPVTGGGIVAFRCQNNCNANDYCHILTYDRGFIRYDTNIMEHGKLIDRFVIGNGGGIFIACKNFLSADTTRLGASWSAVSTKGDNTYDHSGSSIILVSDTAKIHDSVLSTKSSSGWRQGGLCYVAVKELINE